MKNKTIKKALAIGMSVLMLASTFTPVSVQQPAVGNRTKPAGGGRRITEVIRPKAGKISAEPGTILTETVIW